MAQAGPRGSPRARPGPISRSCYQAWAECRATSRLRLRRIRRLSTIWARPSFRTERSLRNLQVSSPIARRLSEGPREREFGHVVCQNAVDDVELSRRHCFLGLHEFHVGRDAGLQFLTNQLEVLFGDFEIVVSDGHLAAGGLQVQNRTTDLG